jgi:hypothetical protein
MHVQPEQVKQALDPKLLQELLKLEQRQRAAELQSQMQAHGVQLPSSSSSSNGSSAGGSSSSGQDGGSSGVGWGQSSGGDVDGDGQWQKLLNAAPWLQDDDGKQ